MRILESLASEIDSRHFYCFVRFFFPPKIICLFPAWAINNLINSNSFQLSNSVWYQWNFFFVFLWALGVDSLAVYQATDLVMLYNPRIKFKTHMCSSFGIRLVLPNRWLFRNSRDSRSNATSSWSISIVFFFMEPLIRVFEILLNV